MTPYQTQVIADGAVSYVPGNEPTNPLNDIVQGVPDQYGGPHPSTGNPALPALGSLTPGFVSGGSASSIAFPNPFASAPTLQMSVEMWFNSTDNVGGGPSRGGLLGQVAALFADIPGAGLADWGLSFYDAMVPSWGMGVNSSGPGTDMQLDAPHGYNDGQWHHIVVTWDGSTGNVKMYVDAVNVASTSGGRTLVATGNSQWYCGVHFFGWNGFANNWAVYGNVLTPTQILNHYTIGINTTYNPPTHLVGVVPDPIGAPLVGQLDWTAATSTGDAGDLLLHFNGTNGQTAISDSSSVANVMTEFNGAALSTASPKFGSAAGSFSTTAGSGWFTPLTPNGPLDLQVDSFTVECWVNLTASGTRMLWSNLDNGVSAQYVRSYINNGAAQLQINNGVITATLSGPGNTTNDGAWHHVVASADTATGLMGVAVDGVWGTTGNTYAAGVSNSSVDFYIGYDTLSSIQSTGYVGQIDEFRVSNGTVVYPIGVGFVPPITPFADPGAPPPGYDVYRDGVSIATFTGGSPPTEYIDTVPAFGTYTYRVAAWNGIADASAPSNPVTLVYAPLPSGPATIPNFFDDELMFSAFFGGVLNLVEFVYLPERTPFLEGATNLIINRYKQEPGDNRQRGVDYQFFLVPGETIQTLAVTGISAQGVLQANTDPLVTPLVVTNLLLDPSGTKFAYNVSGGQNGVEYTVQFTTTTQIQTSNVEEIFSINILVEDSFP